MQYIYLKGLSASYINGKTRCLCTKDYLVFTSSNEVIFVKLPKNAIEVNFVKKKENTKDLEKKEPEPDLITCEYTKFYTINLSNLFIGDEEMAENFRIYTISQKDLEILSKARQKNRQNINCETSNITG